MTMTIEEKLNKDILWVINELQAELIVSSKDVIRYIFVKEGDAPTEREQERVIRWLSGIGAVEQLGNIREDNMLFNFHPLMKAPIIGCQLRMNEAIFLAVRKIYEEDITKKPAKQLLEQAEALGRAKYLETGKLAEPKKINIKPALDEASRSVIFLNKKSSIPAGNQWILCKELFKKNAGDWVNEDDVVENFTRGDNKQSFYDAHKALNKRIEKDLGIVDFIEYGTAMARINPKMIEKLNQSEK